MFKLKNLYKDIYTPYPSFVVRNPLMPAQFFYDWCTITGTDVNDTTAKLRQGLKDWYSKPVVQEALYISSPDLFEQLQQWLTDSIEKQATREKIEMSLIKYFARMCTRCTPYGLLACCAIGQTGETTDLQLADINQLLRKGRLDMDYVCQLAIHIIKLPVVATRLKFYPNTSLYTIGESIRYIEHRFTQSTGRSYHLVQLEATDYLLEILEKAKQGARMEELAEMLVEEEITIEEAREFIYELITNQVLISELDANVTGEEFFSILLRKLKQLHDTEGVTEMAPFIEAMEKVDATFQELKTGNEAGAAPYRQVAEVLRPLEIPLQLKSLIQVDTYRPLTQTTLHKRVLQDMLKGAGMVHLLNPNAELYDSFSDFKNAFNNRYEMQWVPLVEVLDTESGIGYGEFSTTGMEESPLINDLPIADGGGRGAARAGTPTEEYKWKLYEKALRGNLLEVAIEDELLEELSKKAINTTGLADSASCMVEVIAPSAEALSQGNFKIAYSSINGPSGAILLSRFCHLNADIEKMTNEVLRLEEAHEPDAIFAEIVHLPESRIGNILMRPVLRPYEITYLGGSTVPEEYRIPVTDLMVGIERGQVMLFSQRLQKRIIPRLTNAHNFAMTTLPMYKFLCDLQRQQIKFLNWGWGTLDGRPFLPRVVYQNIILSRAHWSLRKDDIKHLDNKNDAALLAGFQQLAAERKMPEFLYLSQGDNELLLNCNNIFSIKILLEEIRKGGAASLKEVLDTPDNCWIESPGGKHTNEFIFSFTRQQAEKAATGMQHKGEEAAPQRLFTTASEWLYVKVYCGTKTAEKVLAGTLKPFVEKLMKKKLIDRFFFLRYADPEHHIRIRFHCVGKEDAWKKVMEELKTVLQPLVEERLVHKIQTDTYQREVERYGVNTMELSEEIFSHDSLSILQFIDMLEGDEGEDYRWKIAIRSVDSLLDDFGYTAETKHSLVKRLQAGFIQEFRMNTDQRKKLADKFYATRAFIGDLLAGKVLEEQEEYGQLLQPFFEKAPAYREAIAQIQVLANEVPGKLDSLLESYIHMHLNRLFVSNQRKHEMVIYFYLFKHYDSLLARKKQGHAAESE
jgi:lantibiotic biosynthesis protein